METHPSSLIPHPFPILVSACLMGNPVRPDGSDRLLRHDILDAWRDAGRLVVFCPETGGGLPVPRPPAEIVGGEGADVVSGVARVVTNGGADVSEAFLAGARAALAAAVEAGVKVAVLKEGSPSCGSGFVYDGSFQGVRKAGQGVTVALLEASGIRVFSEARIVEADAFLRELENESVTQPDR